MPLAEALTIEVGAAIAKSILKLWLKDSEFGNDTSSSLIDLFKTKTSDKLAQRRAGRLFEGIGERVGESLLPLFESEGAHLDEGGRIAVAEAVAETLNQAKLSAELLADRNLQPIQLAHHVLALRPNATRDFSAAETAFYQRMVQECCTDIIEIASQLPLFSESTFAEVLKREDQISAKVDRVLLVLSQISEHLNPKVEAEHFEIEYRRAVARNLDELLLIGADVSLPNRRHKLSVAYITLSMEQKRLAGSHDIDLPNNGAQVENESIMALVNAVLASSQRLLIRGSAGSGKTTLLQWIAVKAATKSFEEPLAHWNDMLPFYIRLRQYGRSNLPRPEMFIAFSTPAIADIMPKGWIHNILRSGRAVVLIDGVDELSASKRDAVHYWLRDLVETYTTAHFIVTSRSYAIEEGWMNREAFSDAELQPMGLTDIFSFIEHWHSAVREELEREVDKNELAFLAEHLKEQIRRSHPIRLLAASPLLCAMLCALNRERKNQLPLNRIDLYKACCDLLIERRDKESHVDLSDFPAQVLNYAQKQRMLEDLAYSMLKEGQSEVSVEQVDERFTRKLANMLKEREDISGSDVRKLFVQRSSIIREPTEGMIDFTHHTFEEFFAAQAAMNARDIEILVANAHDDQWQGLIILAAGLAHNQIECEQLIMGLINRGDQEKKRELRYRLHLLCVSCLETANELGPAVRAEVEKRLSKLVPPRDMADARALATSGDVAIKYLVNNKKGNYPTRVSAACVHTLATIGGDAALNVLEFDYANDRRSPVVKELIKAWDSFDREAYASRVLAQTWQNSSDLRLERLSSLEGMQYFSNVSRLTLYDCPQVSDLSPLANLIRLSYIFMSGFPQVGDLSPLANLAQLFDLTLYHFAQVSDLSPLARLSQLHVLALYHCPSISDLSPLAELNSLKKLLMLQTMYDQVFIPQSLKEKITIVYEVRDQAYGPWVVVDSEGRMW